MKFSCNKDALFEAVSNVSRAVSAKSTIPALEGILLRSVGNKLFISGYDLQTGISTSIAVDGAQDGEIILSARLFADIVRRMPSDLIQFSADEKLLTQIVGGSANLTLLGIPSTDYPEMPTFPIEYSFTMAQSTLKNMISQTLYATAQVDTRPALTGSLFSVESDSLTVVSVDGNRLALRTEPMASEEEYSFIVPAKTLSEIEKLLSEEDEDEVTLNIGRKNISFVVNGYTVLSRLLDGEFLNYKTAIPKESKTQVRISVKEFTAALERVSLLITDRLRTHVRCIFEENELKLGCVTTIGKASDSIPCKTEGSRMEIGFNNRYLLDALRYSHSDEVILEMASPYSPLVVKEPAGDSCLFLVMPVRMKAE